MPSPSDCRLVGGTLPFPSLCIFSHFSAVTPLQLSEVLSEKKIEAIFMVDKDADKVRLWILKGVFSWMWPFKSRTAKRLYKNSVRSSLFLFMVLFYFFSFFAKTIQMQAVYNMQTFSHKMAIFTSTNQVHQRWGQTEQRPLKSPRNVRPKTFVKSVFCTETHAFWQLTSVVPLESRRHSRCHSDNFVWLVWTWCPWNKT